MILEDPKKQVFILFLENTFFEKPHRVGGGQIDPPPPQVVLGLDFLQILGNIYN